MRLSGVVSASTGGRGKKCQAECGFLGLLAAAATVYCGNMPLHAGLVIKQNKADGETEAKASTGERQVTSRMPTKKTTTTTTEQLVDTYSPFVRRMDASVNRVSYRCTCKPS